MVNKRLRWFCNPRGTKAVWSFVENNFVTWLILIKQVQYFSVWNQSGKRNSLVSGCLHTIAGALVISVLPGSRVQEVRRMLPLFRGALHLLSEDFPDLTAVIPTAPSPLVTDIIKESIKSWKVPVIILPSASEIEKYDAFAVSAYTSMALWDTSNRLTLTVYKFFNFLVGFCRWVNATNWRYSRYLPTFFHWRYVFHYVPCFGYWPWPLILVCHTLFKFFNRKFSSRLHEYVCSFRLGIRPSKHVPLHQMSKSSWNG